MRAKFTVYAEEHSQYGSITYKLQPVISGCEENAQFFNTTPSGNFTITIKSSETSARLTLGKDYFIDFVEVE